MSIEVVIKALLAGAATVFLISIAGCDSSGPADQANAQESVELNPRSLDWYLEQPNVRRAKMDESRARVWTLQESGIVLFSASSHTILRLVSLPGWIWAREPFAYPPDLAIAPNGDVFVSSNVIPVIWRIDTVTFQVSQHDLAVDDKGKDIGFSAMAFSTQQAALFAINGLDGSLWRIDSTLKRAHRIPLSVPIRGAYGLAVKSGTRMSRIGDLCALSEQGEWTVYFAPDYRSGYVRAEPCPIQGLAPAAMSATPVLSRTRQD